MLIATRTLKVETADGDIEVPVRLFAPEPAGASHACRYEIDWPEGRHVMAAHGVDSIQSIVLALRMIGAELYASSHHRTGTLAFEKPGEGYGFSVPRTIRNLLIGGDREIF